MLSFIKSFKKMKYGFWLYPCQKNGSSESLPFFLVTVYGTYIHNETFNAIRISVIYDIKKIWKSKQY